MTSSAPRRRKLTATSPTQKKILLGFCLVPVISLVLLFLLVTFFAERVSNEALAADVELGSLSSLLWVLAIFMVASAAVTFYQALKHSLRIAGPIDRITRSLEEVAAGDRELRIRLRNGDYLQGIATGINTVLDGMETETPAVEAKTPEKETVETP